jgi:hypothetical protein
MSQVEDAAFFKKMSEIVPVYREAMGYRRGRADDAAGAVMPYFSLPATIALAIIAGCAGYFSPGSRRFLAAIPPVLCPRRPWTAP